MINDAVDEAGDRPAAVTGTMVGRYMLGRVVGKGLSSEVRLATDMDGDRLVALKILKKEWIWKNDMSALVRREIEIMRELDHPSVVKLIEVFNSDTHVFMAMEAVDGRELYEEISRKGMLEERRASDLFQQLMVAVDYIHSLGVAHRDLKLENLLLSGDGKRIKVTDFGLAARLDEWEGDPKHQRRRSWGTKRKQRRQQTACGTPSYAAPEIIASSETQGYDARGVDIWCAGVVLYAMVTGKMPFRGEDVNATLDIIRAKEPVYPKQLSPEILDLLRSMLQKDPSKRMSVAGVLAHPWTTLPAQQSPISSKKLESLLGASVATPEAAPSAEEKDLAAAARDAIETAKQAALSAERAAVAAREAETTATAALAAAADAAASRSSSPALASRSRKGDSSRSGIDGSSSSSEVKSLASPRGRFIPELGQKITRMFGRQSSLGGGGYRSTKDVEADRAASTGRSSSVTVSRRAMLTHSKSTVGPRDRAWSGDVSRGDRGDDDAGTSRSASMSASLAGRQHAPSHTYGMDEAGVGHRRGEINFPAGGIFASTKASVGSATVAARRKLLRRSSTTAGSTNKLATSMVHSGCTLVTPAAVAGATATPGRGSGETTSKTSTTTSKASTTTNKAPPPAGGGSSVRARAHRASVNFALLSSMVKDYRDTTESESSRQNTARPTTEHSLSSTFAATGTGCVTPGSDSALESDGSGVPDSLTVAEMVTAASSPPSSDGGTDSSSRDQGVSSLAARDIAFDVVASPASVESVAAATAASASTSAVVVSPPAVEVTHVGEESSLEKSAPTMAEQSIPPSLSSATTMSASPSPEDASPISATDPHQLEEPGQEEGQGRPSSPVTSSVSLEDPLPPGGLELPTSSTSSPRSSSGETSAEISAETSAEKSAETSAEGSSERPSADVSADSLAEASTGRSMGSVVEGSAEPAPGPEGGVPMEKPTGLPTGIPTELPAELPSPSTREVEMLAAVAAAAAAAASPNNADAATSAATTTDAAVEASAETLVEQSVEKKRTVTGAAAAAAVAAATAVGVVAAAAASAVASAAVAITSPAKDKAAETAAGPPAAADLLVEQEACTKGLSRRRRAMASQLPSGEEAAACQNKETMAKNLTAAASGAAVSSPGPGDMITTAMEFLSPVPTLVLNRSVSERQREGSPDRGTQPQGRAASLRGRPLPSRSTPSQRGRSPRGRSPRGRGRSLSPKSKSKSMSQPKESTSTRARSMSRSLDASLPLLGSMSMSQSEEWSSPSPLPAAIALASTSGEISIMTQSSSSSVSTAADQQAAGDGATPAETEGVAVVVVAGTAATTCAAELEATKKDDANNNKNGKDAWKWSSEAGGGGVGDDPSGQTDTVVSPDSSASNNLRERVEEENIWVLGVGNGDAVRHRATGRYRRGGPTGQQHRPSSAGGSEAPGVQAPAPSSGPTAEASGGVIAAAVAARGRMEAAAKAAAAVPAPGGTGGPTVVTIEAKKTRKRGKSISRTVARMFGRRERSMAVTRGGGVGQGVSTAKSS